MLEKHKIITLLNQMPNQIGLDELLDKLVLLQKIDIGRKQSQAGNLIDNSDLDNHLPEWLM